MAKTQTEERLAYSPESAARATGLSLATIHRLLKDNKLGHTKCYRRILITKDDLLSFLGQKQDKPKSRVQLLDVD